MRIPFLRRKAAPDPAAQPGTEVLGISLRPEEHPEAPGPEAADLPLAPAGEEPPVPAPAQEPPRADLAPVSLVSVLSRRTLVHWAEGVAVLSGVCATALAADPDAPRIPDAADIAITAEGAVLLRGGRTDADASRRLARILHELLAAERVPASLRLFISTVLDSPEPRPIQQFARELGYFARPDGPELIRALYDRYHHGPVAARPTPASAPAAVMPRRRQRAVRRRRGRRVAVLVVLAALGAGALAAWAWVQRDPAGADARIQAVAERLQEAAREARAAAGELARSLGVELPGLDPGDTPPDDDGDTPTAPAGPSTSGTLAVPEPPEPEATLTPRDSADPEPAAPGPPTRAAAAASASPANDGTIYSGDDLDVEPPVMTYPQVPPPPADATNATTIEVIISATGEVEEARMLSPPRRLTDVMLLSNAKAWRFEPARRDGEPVRYRLRVEWAVTP